MNKKAESAVGLTGGEVAKLATAIIGLLILFYLAYQIATFFSDRTDVQKAESELNEIVPLLRQVAETGEEKDYFVTYAPNWYLFSSEFSDLCEGRFCLCICEALDCKEEKTRSCAPTDRFVLLKNGGKEARLIQLENSPSKIKLKFINENAYPFNFGENIEKGWSSISSTTPLFFKFADEWLWSPDLQNWMTSSQLTVIGGNWNGVKPTQANQNFITENLNPSKKSKPEIENFFYQTGAKISEGIYVIEK